MAENQATSIQEEANKIKEKHANKIKNIEGKPLSKAEGNARQRDVGNIGKLKAEDKQYAEALRNAIDLVHSAGISTYNKKDKRLKYKFAQVLQLNWLYLTENKYLTTEEKTFITELLPYVGIGSNCIIKDIRSKVQIPMTQKDIAIKLKTSDSKVSRVLRSLRKKGIIAKSNIPNHDEGEILKGRSHSLYFNPNIIYSGDKVDVEETLITMFNNPPELLRKLPEQLFILQPINKKP